MLSVSFIFKNLSVIIFKSVTCPWVWPNGWWIIISVCLYAYLWPLVPEDNKKAPILAANPNAMVFTSTFNDFIISYTAIPAVTDPPGLFI